MGNEFIKDIKYLLNCFFSIIYSGDTECIICGEYVDSNILLCNTCKNKIKTCVGSYEINKGNLKINSYSGAYYSNIVKELVARLKYKSDFNAGNVLAKYMLKTIKCNNVKFDVITYVPLTLKSFKKRGYNQSKYLAKIIGYKRNTKVIKSLKKLKNTKDQIGLNGEERWKNIKNTFLCINKKDLNNKCVLLIDDVITTGATGFYCAKELLKCGAKEVIILSAARSFI